MRYVNQSIVKQEHDFNEWFQTVVKAGLIAKQSPTPGCQILEENGADLWKLIEKTFDPQIRSLGYRNKSWPALIPMSIFNKEADHIEGFSPELAMVTSLKGKELEDKLCLRPTSETIIYDDMSTVVQSPKDLPIFWNQWCDVWRVEMRTKLLLRTFQFSWHEAHWAIDAREDAERHTVNALRQYKDFCHNVLAMPVIDGEKSKLERFAGAEKTLTVEARMPDGKALQVGTSHLMAKGFAEAYDIKYTHNNVISSPFTGSWGMSTRIMGALVMTHSDNNGLILPPKISPYQVVVMTVSDDKTKSNEMLSYYLDTLTKILSNANVRFFVDNNDERIGRKQYHWEKQGVPIRIIVGNNEILQNNITLIRRDNGENIKVMLDCYLEDIILDTLDNIQKNLFELASQKLYDNIVHIESLDEFENMISVTENIFCTVGWCDEDEAELLLKEKYGYTVRCYPNTPLSNFDKCFLTGKPAVTQAIIAKSY